jgi:uncharacterized membrane protein
MTTNPPEHVRKDVKVAEHTVTVNANIQVVYERWSRMEEFPSFMEGVKEIRWLDEKRFSLISEFGGSLFESLCEVVLRIPGRRIAWRTLTGADSSGVVCFESAGTNAVDVTLKMRYNPNDGWNDEAVLKARIERNLGRFKKLVEG